MLKKYEFVTVETSGAFDRVIKGHREIISDYAAKGYRYAGYLPTKTAPGGGLFEIELIFEIDA